MLVQENKTHTHTNAIKGTKIWIGLRWWNFSFKMSRYYFVIYHEIVKPPGHELRDRGSVKLTLNWARTSERVATTTSTFAMLEIIKGLPSRFPAAERGSFLRRDLLLTRCREFPMHWLVSRRYVLRGSKITGIMTGQYNDGNEVLGPDKFTGAEAYLCRRLDSPPRFQWPYESWAVTKVSTRQRRQRRPLRDRRQSRPFFRRGEARACL